MSAGEFVGGRRRLGLRHGHVLGAGVGSRFSVSLPTAIRPGGSAATRTS